MAFCGKCERERRGGMCRSGTDRGQRWRAGCGGGGGPGSGTGSWPSCNTRRTPKGGGTGMCSFGMCSLWMGASFGRISMRRGEKGGPAASTRTEPGRLYDQSPSPSGGPGQAADHRTHTRASARGTGVRANAGAGGDQATGEGTAPPSPQADRGGQGLQQPRDSTNLSPPGHPPHHAAQEQRAAHRPVRSPALSPQECRRAHDQSLQAVPRHRHPLRETRRQLSTVVAPCDDYPLALGETLHTDPSPLLERRVGWSHARARDREREAPGRARCPRFQAGPRATSWTLRAFTIW